MESIESLNTALENYPGTLIFVSYDREFVSSLATRIIRNDREGHRQFQRQLRRLSAQSGVSRPGRDRTPIPLGQPVKV